MLLKKIMYFYLFYRAELYQGLSDKYFYFTVQNLHVVKIYCHFNMSIHDRSALKFLYNYISVVFSENPISFSMTYFFTAQPSLLIINLKLFLVSKVKVNFIYNAFLIKFTH